MKNFRRILDFTGDYSKHLYGSILLSTLSAILMLLPYYSIYQMITVSSAGQISAHVLEKYGVLALGGIFFGIITYFAALWLSHMAGFRVEKNIRKYGINQLLKISLSFFDNEESGAIRKTIDDNASLTHSFVAHNIPDIVRSVVGPVIILGSIFMINWFYGVLVIAIVIVSLYLLKRMMGNANDMTHYMDALDEMNSSSTEFIRGIALIKLFAVPLTVFKKFRESIINYAQWALNYSFSARRAYVVNQIVLELFPLLLVFTLSEHSMNIDHFAGPLFCLLVSSQVVLLLIKVMYIGENLTLAMQALNRVDNMFVKYQTTASHENFAVAPVNFTNSRLSFENVTFSYGSEQPALENVSFVIPPQKMTVIVGASGSGKSTIARLIIGAYKNYTGGIFIGENEVKNLKENQLMSHITYVSQNSKLFSRSILENLQIANPNASRQRINQALKKACCEDLVAKLPKGLETLLGENGIYLSGGEQQRLALCQAFLSDSQIVILDEVTASIDAANESQMQLAISKLAAEKTLIVIDHKLKITKGAAQVLVFDHGKLVESGVHKELISHNGKYREMIRMHEQTQQWRLGESK